MRKSFFILAVALFASTMLASDQKIALQDDTKANDALIASRKAKIDQAVTVGKNIASLTKSSGDAAKALRGAETVVSILQLLTKSNPELALLGQVLGLVEMFMPAGPSDTELILD